MSFACDDECNPDDYDIQNEILADELFPIQKHIKPFITNISKEFQNTTKQIHEQHSIKINEKQQVLESLQKENEELKLMNEQKISFWQNKLISYYEMKIFRQLKMKAWKGWVDWYTRKKIKKRLLQITLQLYLQKFHMRHFSEWKYFIHKSKTNSKAMKQQEKMTRITKEIITRYEVELQKLRITLTNAHQEIAREHKKRQYIEEKIRKTFLQGMTTMSLETLQLFNDSSSASTEVKTGPFFNSQNDNKNSVAVQMNPSSSSSSSPTSNS